MKGFLVHLAKRYIAGDELKDAIEAALALNRDGIAATIDNVGENVKDEKKARAAVREYLTLLDGIKRSGADSTVSLKLTHMGLDISEELAEKNTERIIRRAEKLGNFVRIDMEGSAYTQKTIRIFKALHERHPCTGIAIQSALKRSAGDVKALIEAKASVRLVKGAYKEPPVVAFEAKENVDKNFEKLMKELLLKGVRPAIATHDERLIEEAISFAGKNGIKKDAFEFQMLLGIKRSLQKRLAREGFHVRVYVPYGRNWLPYTLRRLRERRENVYFLLKNIFE
ncbi:MAG: proline dehydrogenase family protein [Thermodesulfobacteriota bacterium]